MEEMKLAESFKAYEDGKHRRYSLLFAVQGGAFAVAKLIAHEQIGQLTLRRLAVGMILFTVVMAWDIFEFGQKMRRGYLPNAFSNVGKAVLVLISVLLCAAWVAVSG